MTGPVSEWENFPGFPRLGALLDLLDEVWVKQEGGAKVTPVNIGNVLICLLNRFKNEPDTESVVIPLPAKEGMTPDDRVRISSQIKDLRDEAYRVQRELTTAKWELPRRLLERVHHVLDDVVQAADLCHERDARRDAEERADQ